MALVIVEQLTPTIPTLSADQNMPTINEAVNQSQPTVMTTTFICQQIDMGINNLIYQILKQLTKIVKPMMQNEMHNMHEQEQKQCQMGGHFASSFIAYQRPQQQPQIDLNLVNIGGQLLSNIMAQPTPQHDHVQMARRPLGIVGNLVCHMFLLISKLLVLVHR